MRPLAAALLCMAATAVADVTPPEHREGTPPPCGLQQARDLYRSAVKHYDLGQYDAAVADFQKAFTCKPEPAIVYNIAQSQRLGNRPADAVASYRSYLRLKPDAPNRAEVEQKIADLEARSKK